MKAIGLKQKSMGDWVFDTALIVLMTVFSIVMLYPFLYILAMSLNQGMDAVRGGITIFPRKFTLENYKLIFEEPQLLQAGAVSISRTVIGTLLALLFNALVAFCFTKRKLIGYKVYMMIVILCMYISAGLIPTYLIYKTFGLTNNFLVYIIPNLMWGTNIIIMRTFFDELPPALQESAFMDGAADLQIFFKLILPLSAPVLATIGLFNAVFQWNSWSDTVFFTRSRQLDTLISLLAKMLIEKQGDGVSAAIASRRVQYTTPEVLKAAMTMVTTLPIILVYPFLQKHFVKGVMIGAVKG